MPLFVRIRKRLPALASASLVVVGIALAIVASQRASRAELTPAFERKARAHFDHTPVIPESFDSPQAVTRKCLECHPTAAHVMRTSHFQWLGPEAPIAGRPGAHRIGKRNLINNFCIATRGNERSCMKCHAGYGWSDANFDFSKSENVDCLVCHEHSGTYVKGEAGVPTKESNVVAAARSVGTPTRENCVGCHAYGGGGQAVKHGDLDSSLLHPTSDEDVHIGKHGFLCVDCHTAPDHQLRGRAFSVSAEDTNGVACADCHREPRHADQRIQKHLDSVACQACHIPTFARMVPTKATWDWSRAGDPTRQDDPHTYLKIKGEFTYEQDVIPEYRWFNLTVSRYLAGDRVEPDGVTVLNAPQGDIGDRKARIWPFKVHRALQPYDAQHRYLLAPITGGEGGYWTTFDWDSAFRLAETTGGLAYSGHYGFAKTEMYWPITHMVTSRDHALTCVNCHGEGATRIDWKALGYAGDPILMGGR
jgi:octaheme c-type cytochrome (tetrathionate reductase family)